MDLSHCDDAFLLRNIKNLVLREREATTAVLHHLREIESRRLFSDLGYSSMFNFVVHHLGYSESGAYRRIQAARLLIEIPSLEEKVEQGSLYLTNLAQAAQHFKNNEIFSKEAKGKVLKEVENTTKKECERKLLELSGKKQPPKKETLKRDSATTHQLKFSISEETLQKLEELKALLAHKRKTRLSELFDFALDAGINHAKKEKFKIDPSTRRKSKIKSQTRYIPAGVKRTVYEKGKGRCANCGSRHKLEFDHIKPYAFGGDSSEENLRLLCFNCNQRQRIKAGLRVKAARIPKERALSDIPTRPR